MINSSKYNYLTLAIFGLCFVFTVTFSVNQVFHGLQLAGNFKNSPDWIIWGIAIIIEMIGIGVLYCGADMLIRGGFKNIVAVLLGSVVALIFACIELLHTTMIQIEAGQGDSLITYEHNSLAALNNQVGMLDSTISTFYKNKRDTMLESANNSAKGLDITGKAIKGSLYKARIQQWEKMDDYVDLGLNITNDYPANGTAEAKFSYIQGNWIVVKAKADRFNAFVNSLHIDIPQTIEQQSSNIATAVDQKAKLYEDSKDVTGVTLAMNKAFDLPSIIWTRDWSRLNAKTKLSVAYGAIPFFAKFIFLTICLYIWAEMNGTNETIDNLERQYLQNEEKYNWLEKINQSKSKVFVAKTIRDGYDKIFKKKSGKNDDE